MDQDAPAAVVETHVSWVFFVGDGAYKLKKPVKTAFLDFSSPEQRRLACDNEVRLNRRLAPDVYRGVLTLTGADGTVCDHLVAMRRLPVERRLSALIERRDPALEAVIDGIAVALASFHERAERSPVIDAVATPAAVAANWAANTHELGPFEGTVVEPAAVGDVQAMADHYLRGRSRLLDQRIAAHRIVDGHGDLLAGDVFALEDGPRLLDCLEFADRLRYGDALADVAFLAMDVERLGRPDLAVRLLAEHRARTGDDWPPSLAHHYVAYRAQVRAKVACLRAGQGGPGAAREARELLEQSRGHLRLAVVTLVLVGGLPGTGKTTLAQGLAGVSGAAILRSDLVRKELAGLGPRAPAPAAYRQGIYDAGASEAVYAELLRRAGDLLALGRSVVIDASWGDAGRRDGARRLASSASARLVELCCRAPRDLTRARMRRRSAEGADASDATPEVAEAMSAAFATWPEAGMIDTARDEPAVLVEAVARTGLSPAAGWSGLAPLSG